MVIDILSPLTPNWFTRDFDDAARLIPTAAAFSDSGLADSTFLQLTAHKSVDGFAVIKSVDEPRLNDGLTSVGLPLGGETGALIARRLAVGVNPDPLVT